MLHFVVALASALCLLASFCLISAMLCRNAQQIVDALLLPAWVSDQNQSHIRASSLRDGIPNHVRKIARATSIINTMTA